MLLHIREVPDSNLSQNRLHVDSGFSSFSSVHLYVLGCIDVHNGRNLPRPFQLFFLRRRAIRRCMTLADSELSYSPAKTQFLQNEFFNLSLASTGKGPHQNIQGLFESPEYHISQKRSPFCNSIRM
jgi:hypothetical protein